MKTLLTLALTFAAVGCAKSTDNKEAPAVAAARFEIAVTEKGFEPDNVKVPAAKPVVLVFDRKTDQTCAKQVVIKLGDGTTVKKDLPMNTPVEIATTFAAAGNVSYACGMDMVHATITVQ